MWALIRAVSVKLVGSAVTQELKGKTCSELVIKPLVTGYCECNLRDSALNTLH